MNPIARRTLLAAIGAATVSTLGGGDDMGVISDAAVPRGDVMRRLDELEERVGMLSRERRLTAASIGSGGLRIRGGRLTIQDEQGDQLRAGGDPGEFFLRPDLLDPFARAVLAAATATGSIDALESTTSTSYTDLNTVGPAVSAVQVEAGAALVFISGNLSTDVGDGANMSFEVTGATELEAGQTGTLSLVTSGDSIAGSVTKVVPLLELNPGQHSFLAKYRSGSGGLASFNQRVLTVIAF